MAQVMITIEDKIEDGSLSIDIRYTPECVVSEDIDALTPAQAAGLSLQRILEDLLGLDNLEPATTH